MQRADYVIVGTGLTGAVIARSLHEAGCSVLCVERREHVGGNVHDHVHESGIRVHTYGPHYFRTNDLRLWEFVNGISPFFPFEAVLKSAVDGAYENWPISGSYIRRLVGASWEPSFTGTPSNFEEAALAIMPRIVYEKFVRGYTQKQWGVDPRRLSARLARRFDVRWDDDPRLMQHRFQGIPAGGYAAFMARMLDGIECVLGCDYLRHREAFIATRALVFTGPIDEYFRFDLGRLKYRGQRRSHEYHPSTEWALPCGQVNNPGLDAGEHIRTMEWKHMMPPDDRVGISGTLLTRETTVTPDDPAHYEYPFPDDDNAALYARYRARADATPGLLICGRLGEYRYFDMDQAIARAQVLARRLLTGDPVASQ